MDLALVVARSVVTVAVFCLFVALCVWAWSDRRRDEFSAAARLPFDEDEL
jgi:cbb3-type cytochrome oxidase subunit 3